LKDGQEGKEEEGGKEEGKAEGGEGGVRDCVIVSGVVAFVELKAGYVFLFLFFRYSYGMVTPWASPLLSPYGATAASFSAEGLKLAVKQLLPIF
jgi:hypothetical protein